MDEQSKKGTRSQFPHVVHVRDYRVDSEFSDYRDKSEPTKPPPHYRAGLVCPTFIAAPPLLVPSSSLSAFFSHFPPFATHTGQKIPRLNACGWAAHHISCARHEWAGCSGKGDFRESIDKQGFS